MADGALDGSLCRRDRVLVRRRTARLEGAAIHFRCAGGAGVGRERRNVGCVGGTTAAPGDNEGPRVVCKALLAPRPKRALLLGGAQAPAPHLAQALLESAHLVAHVSEGLGE